VIAFTLIRGREAHPHDAATRPEAAAATPEAVPVAR